MTGTAWRDDVLVTDGCWRKRYAAVPCVRVEVWPVAQPLGAQQLALLDRAAYPPPAPAQRVAT